MTSSLPEDAIRARIRRRRQQLGCGAQLRAAHRLSTAIQQLECYQRSQHIAFYSAVNGEIGLQFLLKAAWSQGKTCYLPVVNGECMVFIHYNPGSCLANNRFGIPEPSSGGMIPALSLDMVLTPLVAFDDAHHRIGMGGGFYDRTFAALTSQCTLRSGSPFLLGVAHRCQRVNNITPKPWDIVMNHICVG